MGFHLLGRWIHTARLTLLDESTVEKAAALRYIEELPAPFVIASGKGALARAIERLAVQYGIHCVEEPELADSLIELGPGAFIPEEYYEIIAELLAFVRCLGRDDE